MVVESLEQIAKWILVLTVPAYKDFPMFFLPGQEYPGFEYAVSKLTLTLALGYVVLALIQELIAEHLKRQGMVIFTTHQPLQVAGIEMRSLSLS